MKSQLPIRQLSQHVTTVIVVVKLEDDKYTRVYVQDFLRVCFAMVHASAISSID